MRRKGWTAVKKMVCTAAVLGLLLMNAAALPELGALHAKSAALYAANGQEKLWGIHQVNGQKPSLLLVHRKARKKVHALYVEQGYQRSFQN